MRKGNSAKAVFTALVVLAVFGVILDRSQNGKAASVDNDGESKIKRGFEIAPVTLNLKGKNRARGTGQLHRQRHRRLQRLSP